MTMLYRSTDRLCRRGAPMKNLAHSASFESLDKDAPSKPGTKHLVCLMSVTGRSRKPQQTRIKRQSKPSQSGRSRIACISRAMGIASLRWCWLNQTRPLELISPVNWSPQERPERVQKLPFQEAVAVIRQEPRPCGSPRERPQSALDTSGRRSLVCRWLGRGNSKGRVERETGLDRGTRLVRSTNLRKGDGQGKMSKREISVRFDRPQATIGILAAVWNGALRPDKIIAAASLGSPLRKYRSFP